jgi:membrane protease YdiL (CAAX protease family)
MAYHSATRTATYGFLSALPLFALYETLIVWVNVGTLSHVRISAEVWLKDLLALAGATNPVVLCGIVVLIGLGVFFWDRPRSIPLRGSYFAGIVAESAFYAVIVAFLASGLVGMVFGAAPQPAGSFWTQLTLSIGAGLYEELLFRVLLVGGLALLLRPLLKDARYAYPIAALVGALLFSAVHYIGPLGDPLELSSFMFRFVFGLLLNVLFLGRGFGVAAWTHALYDVMLVVGLLG